MLAFKIATFNVSQFLVIRKSLASVLGNKDFAFGYTVDDPETKYSMKREGSTR